MRRLYKAIQKVLEVDTGVSGDLAWLLGAVAGDPRIYQTAVQEHVQAANSGIRWVTYNKAADEGDGTEQDTDVRLAEIDFHCWARESDSGGADAIHDRLRFLLDGKDDVIKGTDASLLVMWCNYLSYTKQFEPETKLWHVTATFSLCYAEI